MLIDHGSTLVNVSAPKGSPCNCCRPQVCIGRFRPTDTELSAFVYPSKGGYMGDYLGDYYRGD